MVQRILKPADKLVIIVDYREKKSSVIDYLKEMGALVKPLSLKVGDFVCSDRVCVEKKIADDFVSSIIDGRLFKQAEELKDNFSRPILLVEGNYFREGMNENAIRSALASIVLDFEIPIIMTKNEEETARTIFWLAKREQTIGKRWVGISGRKKPKTLKELQEYFISGLPGISIVFSKRILREFRTIKNFVDAEESELLKVKGVGKVLAKRIHEILNEEYR